MSVNYVIRGYHWGYNDEVFYPCGNYVKSSFDSEAEAKAKLLTLERRHWERMDLSETGEFFDGSSEYKAKLNAFVLEKSGKPLFGDDEYRDVFLPKGLSDDDFSEFLALSGLSAYKLVKFEDGQSFHAIWFFDDEDYLKEYDESSTSLVYSESIEELKRLAESELTYHWDEKISIAGDMAEISTMPEVLKSLINTHKSIKYSDDKGLEVDPEDLSALYAVNEVLKKPLFEIKSLSVDEVMALESELAEECY